MNQLHRIAGAVAAACAGWAACAGNAAAFTFETEAIKGSFDSTITVGAGKRLQQQSCGLLGAPTAQCSEDQVNPLTWSGADDGNLNYNKGDFFTAYLKGSHELLLSMPSQGLKFMARANWLKDFKADDTRSTPLLPDAKKEIVNDVNLVDLWVSKSFSAGEQTGRVKIGNQVISWGESLFALGGINATNAVDIVRLSSPGLQLKEVFLPAPMASVSSSLAPGVSVEGYYQFKWNRYKFPPAGSYWSQGDIFDKGRGDLPFLDADKTPKDGGQFGLSLRWKSDALDTNFGFYAINYHDKTPNLNYVNAKGLTQWTFLENRKLYGVSANTSVGDWALGAEVSYRPKDAVALSACADAGTGGTARDFTPTAAPSTQCPGWIDNKRYQLHVTGLYSLIPSNAGAFLKLLGADTGTFLGEFVAIRYPGISPDKLISRSVNGVAIEQVPVAGLWWLPSSGSGVTQGFGDATSMGFMADFSLVYDGSLIPGWQVIPGMFVQQALKGSTPNFFGNWLEGGKAVNFYVNFVQNPATWQAGINVTKFFGGKTPTHQPLGDRDFFGFYVSRNF
ncbi:DUF1302 domain-containing protein [Aquabacterium sp.]|uniref:DUF1302 domain-containing protein n=1 Tax=Aquabacterium sp. TaxID=1872578 RepID=UPI002CCD7F86|nr:DUF1302 domain-containing protein [Aquabacterium sp.]HSW07313.1 DUF1302 domain-containing protein [Aquabacterium sp.]